MMRLLEPAIASIILRAPGWARVGITMRDARIRDAAAEELARVIVAQMDGPFPEPSHPGQLALAL